MSDLVYEYLCYISKNLIPRQDKDFTGIVKGCTGGGDLRLDFLSIFALSIVDQRFTLTVRDEIEKNIRKWFKTRKRKKLGYLNRKLRTWLRAFGSESKGYVSLRRITKGIEEFYAYLRNTSNSSLASMSAFERSLRESKGMRQGKNLKDALTRFPGMGEKTAGLFIKYMAYYSVAYDNLPEWRGEHASIPVFGYSEAMVSEFLSEVYDYYARKLFDEGKFRKAMVNAPVSIDVVWYAYEEEETFSYFIENRDE